MKPFTKAQSSKFKKTKIHLKVGLTFFNIFTWLMLSHSAGKTKLVLQQF